MRHYVGLGFDSFYLMVGAHERESYESLVPAEAAAAGVAIQWIVWKERPYNSDFLFLRIAEKLFPALAPGWVFVCDSDEYLCLRGQSIRAFVDGLPGDVMQAHFPWLNVECLSNVPDDVIRAGKWFSNNHVKSMVRVGGDVEPPKVFDNVHHFDVSPPVSWICGRTRRADSSPWLPDDLPCSAEGAYGTHHPFVFHVHTRSFQNAIFKIKFYDFPGKSDSSQRILLEEIVRQGGDPTRLGKLAVTRRHASFPRVPKDLVLDEHVPRVRPDAALEEAHVREHFTPQERAWLSTWNRVLDETDAADRWLTPRPKVRGVVLIISCHRHANGRLKEFRRPPSTSDWRVHVVMGNPFQSEPFVVREDGTIVLRCEDSYVHLMKKTTMAVDVLTKQLYEVTEGILRCGDDLLFDMDALDEYLGTPSSSKGDYAGMVLRRDAERIPGTNIRPDFWMINYYRQHPTDFENPLNGLTEAQRVALLSGHVNRVPALHFAVGTILWLSARACEELVAAMERVSWDVFAYAGDDAGYPYIIEDVGIAYVLDAAGIACTDTEIFDKKIARHTNMYK